MAAMRQEVAVQVLEFAEQAYGSDSHVPCAITGRLVERSAAHVDHSSPPFWNSPRISQPSMEGGKS